MIPLKDKKVEEYALHIQALVTQLKKSSKKAVTENVQYIIDNDSARIKYNGRIGETFYLFPDDAPSQDIINRYMKCKPYLGNNITFEKHLSHKQFTVIFDNNDLVLRRDRELYIECLTENNINRIIELAKERSIIDWNNAKFYIYPYLDSQRYIFISDSFESHLMREDLNNPEYWITFPFTENFNYKEILDTCNKFVANHPKEDARGNYSYTITLS